MQHLNLINKFENKQHSSGDEQAGLMYSRRDKKEVLKLFHCSIESFWKERKFFK